MHGWSGGALPKFLCPYWRTPTNNPLPTHQSLTSDITLKYCCTFLPPHHPSCKSFTFKVCPLTEGAANGALERLAFFPSREKLITSLLLEKIHALFWRTMPSRWLHEVYF